MKYFNYERKNTSVMARGFGRRMGQTLLQATHRLCEVALRLRCQGLPPASRIFAALDACPLSQVKVVIIGQDPYHGPGQANGMCFSVADGVKFPPSLVNIFKEVSDDTGAPYPASGNLERWASQGVLLLNSILTVEDGRPGNHASIGWEKFTDAVVDAVSRLNNNVVFLLWGSYAIRKVSLSTARAIWCSLPYTPLHFLPIADFSDAVIFPKPTLIFQATRSLPYYGKNAFLESLGVIGKAILVRI